MERYGVNSVKDILRKHGIELHKSMGQHFLIDPNIPEKIVRLSGIDKSCGVLEIGPGIGSLTLELSKAAHHVIAVELDNRLLPILRELFTDKSNVMIVHNDILKLDIFSLISEIIPELRKHVCANLPYNITTPVISALLDTGAFETITIMIQREVARRICAASGTPEYGAFTLYVNYHAEPEILFDVPPECFMPRPSVQSTVLKLKNRSERLLAPKTEKVFFSLVRAAFAQRRKTLENALYAAFSSLYSKAEITGILKECGFDPRLRGETLSIKDYTILAEGFSKVS